MQTERSPQGGKANKRITFVDKIILSQYDANDRLEHYSHTWINRLILKMNPSTHNATGSQASDIELTELVEQASKGNRLAFDQLIDRFQGDIYRMIYYRVRVRMDAEDLAQDVFIRAFRSISRLREPGRFRSWLFTIAVNRVNDYLRNKRVRSIFKSSDEGTHFYHETDAPQEQAQALEQVLKEDFWRQIEQIAKKLSKMEREVFMLRFLDDLNIYEIAQILKKSESTVKTHLYRALTKFKKEKALRHFLQEDTP